MILPVGLFLSALSKVVAEPDMNKNIT